MPKYSYAQACGTRHLTAGPLFSTQFVHNLLIGLFRSLTMLLEPINIADNKSYRDYPVKQASCLFSTRCLRLCDEYF